MVGFTRKPDFIADQFGNVRDVRQSKYNQLDSGLPRARVLTNKRLYWFTFVAWLVGVFFLSSTEKSYDPDRNYRIITYREHRDGRIEHLRERVETGAELNRKEIEKVSRDRVTGICAMVFGACGGVIIVWRLSKGQLGRIGREQYLMLALLILIAVLGWIFVALP